MQGLTSALLLLSMCGMIFSMRDSESAVSAQCVAALAGWARTHAHTYIRTHAQTYIRTHAHTHTHTRARVHAHTRTRAPADTSSFSSGCRFCPSSCPRPSQVPRLQRQEPTHTRTHACTHALWCDGECMVNGRLMRAAPECAAKRIATICCSAAAAERALRELVSPAYARNPNGSMRASPGHCERICKR